MLVHLPLSRSHPAFPRLPQIVQLPLGLLPLVLPTLRSPRFALVLVAVLLVDGPLLGLDLAFRYGVLEGTPLPYYFDLGEEFGFGELWEYTMCGITALATLQLYRRTREPVIAALAALFSWLTLDNAFGLHEAAGVALGPFFAGWRTDALRPVDYGELVAFAAIGAAAIAGVHLGFKASGRWAQAHALALTGCFAAAAGFGVGVDFLHQLSNAYSPIVREAATFVEEAGELTLLSLAAVLALAMQAPEPARQEL